eukprot:CAMPEP_0201487092 /NCGR_PEP_ID=MMETSP0151_2-20130828/11092_1 /ASSEMBLY_ACC=CAM_ASM_000257 /TAXON_ID=200890 /ORGANISM="Paramoeba atlantica, Strain 621/1 / CCAP 1560/9" /LENGTH=274 /DNA_ID=CAMNT_0047872033 /DNA_START=97 /DNA_END=918 /DNA_ORIENTATION=-
MDSFFDSLFESDGEGDEWTSPVHHMIAGSVAGVAEHCAPFPIDTIKTHLQSHNPAYGNSFAKTASNLVEKYGFKSLFRGLGAAALGAGPAHAIHFASYEFCKQMLGGNQVGHHPIANASAGIIAAVISEAVMTPCDSIKQKLQMGRSSGILKCIRTTYTTLGMRRGFYSGYTSALTMNAPYIAIQFATYESLKTLLAGHDTEERKRTIHHLIAGAGGGALAGAATNPVDVVRTRLQTQTQVVYSGMLNTFQKIYREEGFQGLGKGIGTRMVFHS